jgi:hypothetical protein
MKETKLELEENLFDDEEMDFNVFENLVKSYSIQPTPDGPVNNIMTSMGLSVLPGQKSVKKQ